MTRYSPGLARIPKFRSSAMRYSSFFALIIAIAGSVVEALPATNAPLAARDCSAEAAAFNMRRAEKRGLDARSIWPGPQNTTCVLAPESPKNNYVAGMPASSNIVDGQNGLEFVLDVAVMDVTTCKPLANTMVELWSSNAMGQYGNFLRGATTTSSTGVAEFTTIFPGRSVGANHVNIAVHTASSLSSSTAHVGKLYFENHWNELILGTTPYVGNTNPTVLNENDADYTSAVRKGYSPVVALSSIHDDWPEGVVGIITVGVNPR